jgi:hypothetical protein
MPKKEKKLLNILVVKSSLLFLERQGYDLAPLYKKLPYTREYLMNERNWVEEDIAMIVGQYVFSIYGTYEILRDIALDSHRRKEHGFINSTILVLLNPERAARIFTWLINTYIDKSAIAKTIETKSGYLRWIVKRVDGAKDNAQQVFAGLGNIQGLMEYFGCKNLKLEVPTCHVTIDKMGPINGKIFKILNDGRVELTDLRTKAKRIAGMLEKSGTFVWDGIEYGTEWGTAELTWDPLGRWRNLRLLWSGLMQLGKIRRSFRKEGKKLSKKLEAIKNTEESLKKEKARLLDLNIKIDESNKRLELGLTTKKTELYKRYVELDEWRQRTIQQEEEIKNLKNEIIALSK